MDGFADCVPSEAPDGYLSASLQQAVQALIEVSYSLSHKTLSMFTNFCMDSHYLMKANPS